MEPTDSSSSSHRGALADGAIGSTTLHWSDTDLEVYKLVVGELDNNVFVVRCRHTGESALIDAADEHDTLLELCRRLDVKTVLETHGHWDHIGAVPAIRDAGYEVGIGAPDASMLDSYDYILDHDEQLKVGRLAIRTIATPGHTEGCISFKIEDKPLLFVGDSVFPGGPGKTDDAASFAQAIESIDERIFTYPSETLLLPGHGRDTTVGTERPHLDTWADRGW